MFSEALGVQNLNPVHCVSSMTHTVCACCNLAASAKALDPFITNPEQMLISDTPNMLLHKRSAEVAGHTLGHGVTIVPLLSTTSTHCGRGGDHCNAVLMV
eukprot:1157263-Pelagomonas_calceolata.AAC.10